MILWIFSASFDTVPFFISNYVNLKLLLYILVNLFKVLSIVLIFFKEMTLPFIDSLYCFVGGGVVSVSLT